MSKTIDDLRHEHEAILFTLGLLGKMRALAEAGKALDADDALALIAFLKEFADKCHHGKEEGILFPALERAGIANEGGPIGAMLREHELGRGHIRDMEAALRKEPADPAAFARAADAYARLLSRHIEKENEVLFPMGERALGEKALD
ncbi:MAG TPA: hemerythrin domain-containing protein, partial [Spirochaetales bacterium]|nr:hemerythrin domain-containing protein [Spirochaetales bacterium]